MRTKQYLISSLLSAAFFLSLSQIGYAQPTTQSSGIYEYDLQAGYISIGWIRGDGDSCVVFMEEGNAAAVNPVDLTNYTASNNWLSKGTKLGASNFYCVYNGSGADVTVTGLKQSTQYTFRIYEYNGGVGLQLYMTAAASDNPITFTTPAITQANGIYIIYKDSTEASIGWSDGGGDSCLVFLKEDTGAVSNPVNGTTYNASANWNSKGSQLGTSGYYCVYNGSDFSVTVSNLKIGTKYTVRIFEYNRGAGNQDYALATATDNPISFVTSKRQQEITFEWLPTVYYGDPSFKLHASASSGLPVTFKSSNPAIASITDSTVTILKAGDVEITAMQKGNATFDSAYDYVQYLTVNKAPLTVTAENKTRKINTANPAFTITYDGFVKGETISVLTKTPAASCSATEASQAGDYSIEVSGGEAANYELYYISGILTVTSSDCGLQAIIPTTVPPLCNGDTLNLEAQWQDGATYSWYRDGSIVQASESTTYTCRSAGKYSVTVSTPACVAYSNTVTITYTAATVKPVVEVKSGAIGHCSSGGFVTLGTTIAYPSYEWNTWETSATIDVYGSGQYTVTVPDPSGCKVTSAPYEINASEAGTPSICLVTVGSETGKNVIVWKHGTGKIKRYRVYKETTKANKYEQIDSASYTAINLAVDEDSDPVVRSNRYRVSVLDSCDVESPLSTIHKTLHLNLNLRYGGGINLIWENYEGLEFESYNVLHGDAKGSMTKLVEIPSNITSYTILGTLKNYYQISIVLPDTCETAPLKAESGPYSQSLSNIVELKAGNLVSDNIASVYAYPNPFTESITVQYTLVKSSDVRIEFYNAQGQLANVKSYDGEQAGLVEKTFPAGEININSGLCLIKVIVGNDIATKRVFCKP